MADTNQNAKLFSELFGKNTNIIVGSIGSQTAAGTIAQIQTAAGAISANTLRDMSPGVVLLFQASNGLWYCVNADQRATDVISSEVIYKRSTQIVAEPPTIAGKVKVLYFIHEGGRVNFYIGGDRAKPVKIFDIPATMSTTHGAYLPDVYGFINSTGLGPDDWIVQLKYSYSTYKSFPDQADIEKDRGVFGSTVANNRYAYPGWVPPIHQSAKTPSMNGQTLRAEHVRILDMPEGRVPREGGEYIPTTRSGILFDEPILGPTTYSDPAIADKFPRTFAVTLTSKQKWELNGEDAEAISPVGYGFWNATNDVIFPEMANDETYELWTIPPPKDDNSGQFTEALLAADKLEDTNEGLLQKYTYNLSVTGSFSGTAIVEGETFVIKGLGDPPVVLGDIYYPGANGFSVPFYTLYFEGGKYRLVYDPVYFGGQVGYLRANETGTFPPATSGYGYWTIIQDLFAKTTLLKTVFPTFLAGAVTLTRSSVRQLLPLPYSQANLPIRSHVGSGENAALSWYKGNYQTDKGTWEMDWQGTKPGHFGSEFVATSGEQVGIGKSTIKAKFTVFPGKFLEKGIDYKFATKTGDLGFNAKTVAHNLLYVNKDLSKALVMKADSQEYFGEGFGAFKFLPNPFIRLNQSDSSAYPNTRAYDGRFWDWQFVPHYFTVFAYLHFYWDVEGRTYRGDGTLPPWNAQYEYWRGRAFPKWVFTPELNNQSALMQMCSSGLNPDPTPDGLNDYLLHSTPEQAASEERTLQLYTKNEAGDASEPVALAIAGFIDNGFEPNYIGVMRRFTSYVGAKLYVCHFATSATLESGFVPWTQYIESQGPYKRGDRVAIRLDNVTETNVGHPLPDNTKLRIRTKFNVNSQTGQTEGVDVVESGSSLALTYVDTLGTIKTRDYDVQEERVLKSFLYECISPTDSPPSNLINGDSAWRVTALPDITKQEQNISISQYEFEGNAWVKKDAAVSRIFPLVNLKPEMSIINTTSPAQFRPTSSGSLSTDFARAAGRHNILSASYHP